MKRLSTTILILLALLVTSNAKAAFVWNWNIDTGFAGVVSGRLMTIEGYEAGTKNITTFEVVDPAGFGSETPDIITSFGLFVGEYALENDSNTFTWDGNTTTDFDFAVSGRGSPVNSFDFIFCDSQDSSGIFSQACFIGGGTPREFCAS